jgi:hypothetical protein
MLLSNTPVLLATSLSSAAGSMEQSSISLDRARFSTSALRAAASPCHAHMREDASLVSRNRFPYRLVSVVLTRFGTEYLRPDSDRAAVAGFIVHIQRIDPSVANKSKRFRGAYNGNPPCRVVSLASSSTMLALFGAHFPAKHGYSVFKKGECIILC